jgi:hypothetical protein
MTVDGLPEDVIKFIADSIDSVEQLRVLLLLYNSPERAWTTAEISEELRSVESSISKRLEGLYDRHVLSLDPKAPTRHRFNPTSAHVGDIVRRLNDINRVRPYQVIDAIYAAPPRSLTALADAFKFRGGP